MRGDALDYLSYTISGIRSSSFFRGIAIRFTPTGIEFCQGRSKTLSRNFTLSRISGGGDQLLDERSGAHIEEFASLIHLESRLAHISVGAKLNVGSSAGCAGPAAQLRGETLAVGLEPIGQFHDGQFGKGGVRIGKTYDVVEYFSCGRHGGPTRDDRDA